MTLKFTTTDTRPLRMGLEQHPLAQGVLSVQRLWNQTVVGPWNAGSTRTPCGECAALWHADVAGEAFTLPAAACSIAHERLIGVLTSQANDDPQSFIGRATVINAATGEVSSHRVRHHPRCRECAIVPQDQPIDLGELLSAASSSVAPSLRVRQYESQELRGSLLDYRFGPVKHISRDESSPLALTKAEIIRPGIGRTMDEGFGRALTYGRSEIPAFIEGIERAQSALPLAKQTNMWGSYRSLSADAVDPAKLGLHDVPPVGQGRFVPYHPDVETAWVWGWSTREARPLLVPEHVAYWDAPRSKPAFLYESSNGAAAGSNILEAALFGLLEVIERDSFLLAWYRSVPLERIEVALDDELRLTVDQLARRGYEVSLLDITNDFGVPASMAVITADPAEVAAGRARALNVASGAHPSRTAAAVAALAEAGTNALMFEHWSRRYPEEYRAERFRPMISDPDRIRSLTDHTGFFGLNEARPMWSFLTESVPALKRPHKDWTSMGSRAYFARLLEHVHGLGMDVILVDQTATYLSGPEPLYTVKVIVPGSLPMTFGHRNRRTTGFSRLPDGDPLTRKPHPFP